MWVQKEMQPKKLKINTVTSFIYQVTTIICGLILPRLVLKTYGSSINGLINSVNQFLNIFVFMEFGMGTVVQSALYEPLANQNRNKIAAIVTSANKFFSKLAIMLIIYIAILLFMYPNIFEQKFNWYFLDELIIAMAITSFSQYYFGMVNSILLTADQKGYIQYISQTITLVVNTVVCTILIIFGTPIQIVKLTTSLIYLIRPLVLQYYVKKFYPYSLKIKYNKEPISQKWNGVAQHVAAVILEGTDIVILTILSNMANVSIYSVYSLPITGLTQLVLALTRGVHALLGELWALKDSKNLYRIFKSFEWMIHTISVIIFGCTFRLIIPFVRLYTFGVNDTNYVQPIFATLLCVAYFFYCIRLPYNIMILAVGHYKQTQHIFIIAASLNIVISILAVKHFGLIGVTVGTLVAMLFQTITLAYYSYNKILNHKMINFTKHLVVDIWIAVICCVLTSFINFNTNTILEWIMFAIVDAIVWIIVSGCINMLFYYQETKKWIVSIINKIK